MTGVLIGLQILCLLLFARGLAMARVSQHEGWFWLMGLAAVGIVVCAGLGYWDPLLDLGRPD